MRRSRHSRTSGRQQALGDLFAPDTLEGDPTPRAADASFSLRPFAAEIPQATGVDPHAEAPESAAERLLAWPASRLARAAAEAESSSGNSWNSSPGTWPAGPRWRSSTNTTAPRRGFRHLSEAVRLCPDQAEPLVRGRLARRSNAIRAGGPPPRAPCPGRRHRRLRAGFALWRKGVALEAAEHLRRAAELARAGGRGALPRQSLHQRETISGAGRARACGGARSGNPKSFQLMGGCSTGWDVPRRPARCTAGPASRPRGDRSRRGGPRVHARGRRPATGQRHPRSGRLRLEPDGPVGRSRVRRGAPCPVGHGGRLGGRDWLGRSRRPVRHPHRHPRRPVEPPATPSGAPPPRLRRRRGAWTGSPARRSAPAPASSAWQTRRADGGDVWVFIAAADRRPHLQIVAERDEEREIIEAAIQRVGR
jgi:hypothetical protein